MAKEPVIEFAWHVHHDILIEPLTEPIESRREYIRMHKPLSGQPLRLRLLKPVVGKLPDALLKAGAVYDKAGAVYGKARAVYDKAKVAYGKADVVYGKASVAYDKAWADTAPEIEALHRQECPDCPWDGNTIFTRQDTDGKWY